MATWQLGDLTAARVHILAGAEAEAFDDFEQQWLRATPGGIVRVVRGKKCATTQALFDECAAAWQFPYYFGENWNALDECLADLSWLPGAAYIALITHAGRVLDQQSARRRMFWELLQRAAAAHSRPFYIVAHANNRDALRLVKTLRELGVEPIPLA